MIKKNSFFQSNNFVIYNGNSFKLVKQIDEKIIDMIFADPPYFLSSGGISCYSGKQISVNKGDWDTALSISDKIKYNRKWIKECRRVLKDNGTIWISGTFHNIYSIGVALELEGFSIINNITWQKPNPAPNLACRCFTNSTETILWARKQLTTKKKGKHTFNYGLMKEQNGGKQMKDVWLINLPKNNEKRYGHHVAQKPEALLERIILASTNENDLILDPFLGSGTTGVVALKLNRKFIGIEKEVNFLEIAKRRIDDVLNFKEGQK